MHWESVGSQLVIHVNVSSTHTSLQTPFSSKSLENTKWTSSNLNLIVLTDSLDPPFGPLGGKWPGLVKIKRRISFLTIFIFSIRFYLTNSRYFHMRLIIFIVKLISSRHEIETSRRPSTSRPSTFANPIVKTVYRYFRIDIMHLNIPKSPFNGSFWSILTVNTG